MADDFVHHRSPKMPSESLAKYRPLNVSLLLLLSGMAPGQHGSSSADLDNRVPAPSR